MSYTLMLDNVKCGGCANSIRRRLIDAGLATGVTVEVETGTVRIDGDAGLRTRAAAALAQLGYPERGTVDGIRSTAAKARSFVSCAIGRIDGGSTPET